MKIQVMSDLHLEFHRDEGEEFILGLSPDGVDVLVLAGDIGTVRTGLGNKLRAFCDIYPQVVFVLGNHEYYGSSREEVLAHIDNLSISNLHWLNNTATTISGQRFVGGTLWFKDDPFAILHTSDMNDFKEIPKFDQWVHDENAESARFLRAEVGPDDVVVTHYLPSKRSISPRFVRKELNRFFMCEMDDVLEFEQPKLWFHGHTHDSCDYRVGKTRVVCNPFGYEGVELNPKFKDNLVLEA